MSHLCPAVALFLTHCPPTGSLLMMKMRSAMNFYQSGQKPVSTVFVSGEGEKWGLGSVLHSRK